MTALDSLSPAKILLSFRARLIEFGRHFVSTEKRFSRKYVTPTNSCLTMICKCKNCTLVMEVSWYKARVQFQTFRQTPVELDSTEMFDKRE